MVALSDILEELAVAPVSYRGRIAPNVHVFATERAMSRVRSYQSAGLNPIAGRGPPVETVLLAHVHEDAGGAVSLVEGFNGAEGERFSAKLRDELSARGLMPPGAIFRGLVATRDCPYSTRPIPGRR